MSRLILLNKPFNVLSQFSDTQNRDTLAKYIPISKVYAAGRLDYDSEGLLLLTDDGKLQAQISNPRYKLEKVYWVQVDGLIKNKAIDELQNGIVLKDGPAKARKCRLISKPTLWPRTPPIRHRKNQHTSWIEIVLTEGRNRQVRRMTAAVGHPTLRLVRYSIGSWSIDAIPPGTFTEVAVHLPKSTAAKKHSAR